MRYLIMVLIAGSMFGCATAGHSNDDEDSIWDILARALAAGGQSYGESQVHFHTHRRHPKPDPVYVPGPAYKMNPVVLPEPQMPATMTSTCEYVYVGQNIYPVCK